MSGVEILQAIQTIQSPLMDRVFGFITNLHHETVYVLILPLIYWLYDKRFGRYMFSVFVIGFWSNGALKGVFQTPRPDPGQVRVILAETGGGYAFPSGHAQTPLVFWGAIAHHLQRRWFTWFTVVLVFLIGFSRLYIGVHWPLDVLGGWAIGLAVLWLMVRSREFWIGARQGLALRVLLSFLLPGAALGILALLGPVDEIAWVVVGAYGGLLLGSALEEEYVGFDPRAGTPLQHLVKIVIGLALVMAVKEGLKLVLPDTGVGDLVRYWLVALASTLAAPWIFARFIARPPAAQAEKAHHL